MTFASERRVAYTAHVSPFPFEPRGGIALTCSTSSSAAALPTGNQALITNMSSSVYAHVAFGASNITSAASRLAIPPESQVLVTIPEGSTHIAGITASSTADLQIETGFGV